MRGPLMGSFFLASTDTNAKKNLLTLILGWGKLQILVSFWMFPFLLFNTLKKPVILQLCYAWVWAWEGRREDTRSEREFVASGYSHWELWGLVQLTLNLNESFPLPLLDSWIKSQALLFFHICIISLKEMGISVWKDKQDMNF